MANGPISIGFVPGHTPEHTAHEEIELKDRSTDFVESKTPGSPERGVTPAPIHLSRPFRQVLALIRPHVLMTKQDWKAVADRPFMRTVLLLDAAFAVSACIFEARRFETFTWLVLLDPIFLTYIALACGLVCIAFDIAAEISLPVLDFVGSILFIAAGTILTILDISDYNFELALTSLLYFFVNVTIFSRRLTVYVDTLLVAVVAIKIGSGGMHLSGIEPLTQATIELNVLIMSLCCMMTNYISKVAQEGRILALASAREEIARIEASRRLMEENLQLQEDLGRIKRVAAIEAMATSIAHEINQPIGSALSYIGAARRWLAQQPPDLGEAYLAIDGATDQIEKAGEIVTTIRHGASRGPRANPEPVKLADLFETANHFASVYLPDCQRRNVLCVVMPFEPCSCIAMVRRHEIGQVLANLISNALDSFDELRDDGIIKLQVTCKNGWFDITVTDNGSGILPDMAASIFEKFYTTKDHGTGLGLPICRDIAERHGGSLTADRNAAGGTSMRLSIPTKCENY